MVYGRAAGRASQFKTTQQNKPHRPQSCALRYQKGPRGSKLLSRIMRHSCSLAPKARCSTRRQSRPRRWPAPLPACHG
eukprot:366256-Chlamydomonas_euryale.AAC.5